MPASEEIERKDRPRPAHVARRSRSGSSHLRSAFRYCDTCHSPKKSAHPLLSLSLFDNTENVFIVQLSLPAAPTNRSAPTL